MNLPALIVRYLRHLAEDDHRASSTIRGYRAELELLVAREIALSPEALAAHLTWLPDGTPLAATTRNRRLAILRGFVRYLKASGDLASDPLDRIRRAKVPRRARAALTAGEVGRVIAALVAEPPSWRRTRDGALLLLLFYTGLRLSEVYWLDAAQVDLAAGLLRGALRKGGDTTDVALHPILTAQLGIWLGARSHAVDAALFPRGPGVGRLSRRMMQKRLAQLGHAAGLTVPLHPHLLRHAHATGLLRAGVATAVIQHSLNHHALATTEIYLHTDLSLVQEAVARLPGLPLILAGGGDPRATGASTRNSSRRGKKTPPGG